MLSYRDPTIFNIDTINYDPSMHWSIKLSNLKKIIEKIDEYVSTVLDITNNVKSINPNNIAQKNDEAELIKLCEYLPLIAVKCDHKDAYIKNMLSLNEATQNGIMNIVASHIQEDEISPKHIPNFQVTTLEQEISRLEEIHELDEKKLSALQSENMVLHTNFDTLSKKYAELLNEYQEIATKTPGKKGSVDHINELSQSICIKESKIESLQQQIQEIERESCRKENDYNEKIALLEEQIASMGVDSELLMALKSKLSCFDDIKQQYEEMKSIIDEDNHKILQLESKLKEAQIINEHYAKSISEDHEGINKAIDLELKLNEKSMAYTSSQTLLTEEQVRTKFLEKKLKEQSEEIKALQFKVPINGGLSIDEEQKIIEMQNKISILNTENSLLKSNPTNEELLKKYTEKEENLKQASLENKKLTSACHSYIEQIKQLSTKNDEFSKKAQLTLSRDLAISDMQIEFNTLKAERDILYKKQEEHTQVQKEYKECKEEQAQLKAQRDSLQTELNQMYHEKSNIETKYVLAQEDKIEEYKKLQENIVYNKAHEREIERLNTQIEDIKSNEAILIAKSKDLESELEELKKGKRPLEKIGSFDRQTIDALNGKITALTVNALHSSQTKN